MNNNQYRLFSETIPHRETEQYGRTLYNTGTKQITGFAPQPALYNHYNFDPVVFAWNMDPLEAKFPGMSPYSFVANSPIAFVDVDGRRLQIFGTKEQRDALINMIQKEFGNKVKISRSSNDYFVISKVGELDAAQNSMYEVLENYIMSPKFNVQVHLTDAEESEGLYNEEILLDEYARGFLDLNDLGKMSAASNISFATQYFIHYIVEQYHKQVTLGLSYLDDGYKNMPNNQRIQTHDIKYSDAHTKAQAVNLLIKNYVIIDPHCTVDNRITQTRKFIVNVVDKNQILIGRFILTCKNNAVLDAIYTDQFQGVGEHYEFKSVEGADEGCYKNAIRDRSPNTNPGNYERNNYR